MQIFKNWQVRRSGTGMRISGEVSINGGPFGPGKVTATEIRTANPHGVPRVFAYNGNTIVGVLTSE